MNQQIINYFLPYGSSKIAIFGSYDRQQNRVGSDLDILVGFKSPMDLFKFMEIWDDLEDLLGVKVDSVTENATHMLNLLQLKIWK